PRLEGAHPREFDAILPEARERLNSSTYSKEDSAKVDGLLKLAEFYGPDAARDFRNINLTVAERRAGLDEATRRRDFNRYLRYGLNALEPEEKDRLFRHKASWAKAEVRAPRGTA